MMDIDFIKWMVGYAEGFEWSSKSVVTPHDIIVPGSNKSIWKNVYMPLLLQKAIEGFNKEHNILCFIEQYGDHIGCAYNDKKVQVFEFDDMSPYEAKKQAVEYIYEQELKEKE